MLTKIDFKNRQFTTCLLFHFRIGVHMCVKLEMPIGPRVIHYNIFLTFRLLLSVVVVLAKSLGLYHGFSPFMSLVSKFGMLAQTKFTKLFFRNARNGDHYTASNSKEF